MEVKRGFAKRSTSKLAAGCNRAWSTSVLLEQENDPKHASKSPTDNFKRHKHKTLLPSINTMLNDHTKVNRSGLVKWKRHKASFSQREDHM